ncbi:hypothetical protein F5I97DRAFT_635898 [Phlebopus sp. FC_14]|nr:hypothetical protein F5I97DRAFT_635898 [Phlebopus sp. FC_14]
MSQKLTLTTTNLLSTTISNESDTIYYDIQTPVWEPDMTTVRRLPSINASFELTGQIRNEGDKPVSVSMYGAEFEPEEQLLKKADGSAPGESLWQFNDGEGSVFVWSVSSGNLELRRTDDPSKRALVTFYQHRRYFKVGMVSQYAYLEVDASVIESLDIIIVSLLIIERKRRAGLL